VSFACTLVALIFVSVGTSAGALTLPKILIAGGQAIENAQTAVYVVDQLPGAPNDGPGITVTLNGSNIDVCITRTYDPSTPATVIQVYVQLGPFPEGTYQLNYYTSFRQQGQSFPNCTLSSSIVFPVINVSSLANTVEYYDAAQNHYFITANAAEIAALDGGHFPGWVRTGQQWISYLPVGTPPATESPVCRFYGLPQAGLDSHFFTDIASECQYVQDHWSYAWLLESLNAFYVTPIDPDIAGCPPATLTMYRLYNNRPDVNHRYTTSSSILSQMVAQGWVNEGQVWCTITSP
jgi:hypothetical protein